ncbi:hypothetical protein ABWED_1932 [Acinetobacter lwoffii]|nr:hypothetical protein ABWED_1932 [Acinetobacter lwoffii]
MIYAIEYVDFYKQVALLNQSISIVYLCLSSKLHTGHVVLIHAY